MAATILVWYSHSKRLLNFGHVSLAVSHSHAFREQKLATISWFSTEQMTRSQLGCLYVGGFSNPANIGSTAPETSGKSAGFQAGGPGGTHDMPGQVLHEMTGYAGGGANKIRALQTAQLDLVTKNGPAARSTPEYRQLQQQIDKLQGYYPKLNEVRQKQKNQWMAKFIDQYQDRYGMANAQVFLETRVAPASVSVTLPTLSDPGVHAGLNDLAMLNWWEEYLDAKKTYNWRKRNCASTVATALIVGGAAYTLPPATPGMFWAPKNLEVWAKELRVQYEKYEKAFAEAKTNLQRAKTQVGLNGSHGRIWTVQEWKKKSDAGTWSHRYQALTDIDQALELYHKHFAQGHGKFATRNRELQNLVLIAVLLNKILKDRPKTKRKQAIAELGSQVLPKIHHLKQQQNESLGQRYKHYVNELKSYSRDLRDYKNLDELIEQQLPETRQRIQQRQPEDPVEALLVEMKRITEQLDGYEPDATGILGPKPDIAMSRRRSMSFNEWYNSDD